MKLQHRLHSTTPPPVSHVFIIFSQGCNLFFTCCRTHILGLCSHCICYIHLIPPQPTMLYLHRFFAMLPYINDLFVSIIRTP